jgi:hypothetical protein
MNMRKIKAGIATLVAVALVGCGGGGLDPQIVGTWNEIEASGTDTHTLTLDADGAYTDTITGSVEYLYLPVNDYPGCTVVIVTQGTYETSGHNLRLDYETGSTSIVNCNNPAQNQRNSPTGSGQNPIPYTISGNEMMLGSYSYTRM